jgi:hypothetical protein
LVPETDETPVITANTSSYYSTNGAPESNPASISSILSAYAVKDFKIPGIPEQECDFLTLARGIKSLAPNSSGNGKMIGIWTGEQHEGKSSSGKINLAHS